MQLHACSPSRNHIHTMAEVIAKKTPGKIDPFGTGKVLVTDCLDKWDAQTTDPFLLLHAFGPAPISTFPTFGMHPHRGFCEIPYMKKGTWYATDPWNMQGEGEDAKFLEGMLQCGKAGRGIEHGMRKHETYDGLVQGFQMWMNLKGENKLDPPVFQNARPEAMPLITTSPKVTAKLLAGGLHDKSSPLDTFGVDITYVDYMLEAGGEVQCPRTAGRVTAFAYVYEGTGTFGSNGMAVAAGETVQFGASGALTFRADKAVPLGVMVLIGTPLKETIIQRA